MNFIRLLPVIVSLLLPGAHYYRAGFMPLVVAAGAGVLVLLIKQPWVVRIVQTLLTIGGVEWVPDNLRSCDDEAVNGNAVVPSFPGPGMCDAFYGCFTVCLQGRLSEETL